MKIFFVFLFFTFVCPLVNSMGCNYYSTAHVVSKYFGKGTVIGQCQLGVTQFKGRFESGRVVDTKAFSFVFLNKIIFIKPRREMFMSEAGFYEDLSLDVPFLYAVSFKRYNKDKIFIISPKPTNDLIVMDVKGHYSFYDYLKATTSF